MTRADRGRIPATGAGGTSGHPYPEIDASVVKFEARLRERFASATVEQDALISSATALHYAIRITRRRLSAPHTGTKRTGPVYVQLPILVGSQLRCMRALGLIGDDGEEEPRVMPSIQTFELSTYRKFAIAHLRYLTKQNSEPG
jgi:hypothetical protein